LTNGDFMKLLLPSKQLRALTMVELLVVIVVIAILVGLLIPASRHEPYKATQAACQSNLKQIGIAYRTWEGDYGDKYPQELISANSTNFPLSSDPTGYILNHPFPTNTTVGASLPYGYAYQCYQVMSNELNNPKVVLCPSDERPTGSIPSDFINLPPANTAAFNNSTVSFFVGADADESRPRMLLSGDRNLMMNRAEVVTGMVVFGTNTPIGWSTKMHNQKGDFGLADGSVQKGSSGTFQTFLSRTGTNVNRLAVP
jgi:type II secretory pathway pseudopilin PulG